MRNMRNTLVTIFLTLFLSSPIFAATAQIESLLAGVRDTSGNPLDGGMVYTYSAGTTTPKTAWTDKDKSSAATNPVVLDANGRAQIYAEGIYKLVIKSSAGATLYTWDNLKYGVGGTWWSNLSDYATFNAAITAIGSTKTELRGDANATATGTISVPATCKFIPSNKCIITKSGTCTIAFAAGSFEGSGVEHQVFSGFTAGDITGLSEARPEWFGLSTAGTGAANMTALNCASAAVSSGGHIKVPDTGTYTCLGQWTIATACTVTGRGTLNWTTDTADQGILVTASNVTMDGLTLTGPVYLTSTDTQRAIWAYGTDNNPSAPTYISGLKVLNCKISNWGYRGIWMKFVSDFRIAGNDISNIYYSGISGQSCKNGRVHHNRVNNVVGTPNAYGIAWSFDSGTGNTATSDPDCADIVTDHNDISNVTNWEGLDTHAGRRMKFIGNTVNGCKTGIMICSVTNDDSIEYSADHCSAIGNTLIGLGTGYGIVDGGNAGGFTESTLFSANHIYNTTTGIYALNTHRPMYIGNIIREFTTRGIDLYKDIDHGVVLGNNIGPSATAAAIAVQLSSSATVVTRNSGIIAENIIDCDGIYYAFYKNVTTYDDYDVRDNKIIGTPVLGVYSTYMKSTNWDRYVDYTGASTSGTGADTLKTITLRQNQFSAGKGLRIKASGTKTGSAGTKTITLHLGGTSMSAIATNLPADWRLDVDIWFAAANAERVTWVSHSGATVMQGYEAWSEDISAGDLALTVKGECADGADKITLTSISIERMEGETW